MVLNIFISFHFSKFLHFLNDKTTKYSLFQISKNDLQRENRLQFINKINNKITNKSKYLCNLHFKADDIIRTYSFWNN